MRGQSGAKAAFKSPSGLITTGITHADAFSLSDVKFDELSQDEFLDGEGFLLDGRFLSREETLDELGFSCTEDE